MPKAGTRKVEIDGAEVFLPEEEARLTELLQRGCELNDQIAQAEARLAPIKAELIELAEKRRGVKSTVRLPSQDGREAIVSWRKEWLVDAEKAAVIREKLDAATFAQIFTTREVFSAAKGWRAFMSVMQKNMISLKAEIGSAIYPREHRPSCSIKNIGEE